ncbi:MAG: hypothetical protein HKM93_23040 [Desulfobacteraceae bacterium]|nr:hypothetical protein [Desulfobacteraceae bacterium]
MTYNFDPDRWYDNAYDAVKMRFDKGFLSETEFTDVCEVLMDRYEDMLDRLNVSMDAFRKPSS